MKVRQRHNSVLLGSCAAMALALGAPAIAQEGESTETAQAEDGTRRLGSITVTATRREESLQDVPIAVSAYDPVELQRQGIQDLRTLETVSSSFNLQSSQTESQGTSLRIRGIGTTGNNIGLESAVGIFIDGVYQSRPGIALGDLVDLEQIEVLRGPQGTLFGRNTSAGALNITTKKPNLEEVDGFANASYGNLDFVNVQAGFSAPLIEDQLGFRLSGAYRQRDGLLQNPTLGSESNNRDRWLVRGQMLWEPTSDISIRIIGDYAEANEQCCDAVILSDPVQGTGIFGALGPVPSTGVVDPTGGVPFLGFGALDARLSNAEQFQNPFEQWGFSGQVDWDLGLADLTYIGAYRDFRAESVQESDFTGLQIFSVAGVTGIPGMSDAPAFDDITSQTHELRLAGTTFEDKLTWLIGGFYSQEDILEEVSLTLGDDFDFLVASLFGGTLGPAPIQSIFANIQGQPGGVDPSGSFSSNRFRQDSTSWSIFGQSTLSVTDNLDFTVGLRWVDEKKDGTFENFGGSSNACFQVLQNAQAGVFTGDPMTDAGLLPFAGTATFLTCFPFATVPNLPGSGLGGVLPTPVTFSDEPGEPGRFTDDFKDDELVYTVKAAYRFSDAVNSYVSYTHGFKAGGFNLDSTAATLGADPRFQSEEIDVIEVGVKADLFDGRARANLAVFHQEVDNFQVLEFTGIQFQTFNVPSAISSGAELEIQAQLTDQLSVTSALTYTNARYPNDCDNGTTTPQQQALVTGLCGLALTNAPDFTGIWGATWEDDFQGFGQEMTYFLNGNVRFSTERRTGTRPGPVTPLLEIQDENTKLNFRVGFGRADGLWSIEGWINNATDEQTRSITFNVPLRTGTEGAFIEEPRTYGVTLRSRF